MREFIVLTATLVLLAFASRAQEVAVPAPGTDWSPALMQSLFADEATMTLRDEADARARLSALSPEDQAMLRAECAASRGEEAAGTEEPATPEAASDPAAPPEFASDGTGADGSAVPAGVVSLSHLVQVCAWVTDPAQPTP